MPGTVAHHLQLDENLPGLQNGLPRFRKEDFVRIRFVVYPVLVLTLVLLPSALCAQNVQYQGDSDYLTLQSARPESWQ
jgi:hypothetical protein